MKKYIIFCWMVLFAFATYSQTNIAIPRYNTQNIEFYLDGATTPSFTKNTGHGNNGVVFFESDMFVAGGTGIDWYSGVSFNPYNLAPKTATQLNNGVATTQVTVDGSGNVYSANANGTVTKFFRVSNSYSFANSVTVRFGANSGEIMGGLFVGNGLILVSNYTSKNITVAYLSSFPAIGTPTTSGRASFVKLIQPSANIQWTFGDVEGIVDIEDNTFQGLGGFWYATNWNSGTISKIKSATKNSILTELRNNNFAQKNIDTPDIDFYQTNLGNQFGGLTLDDIYSKKLFINDQINGSNKVVLSINPYSATPQSTFATTPYTQSYPGNGQSGIIPCSIMPAINLTVSANPATISSGQTSTLTASGCPSGATYLWEKVVEIAGVPNWDPMSTNASFTTTPLTETTNYRVTCKRGVQCSTLPIYQIVTVNPVLYSISSCNGYTYMSDVVFNKGTASSKGMQVYLANYTGGFAGVTVAGSNITGSGSISAPNIHNFILPTINYDGGGNAGSRTVTVTPSNGTADCITQVIIEEPINFTFGDCSQEILTGNFIYDVPSSGTLTVPITVQSAGLATYTISGLLSGTLTTNLSVGQTSVTIPISYLGGQSSPFDVEWTTNITMAKSYQATHINSPYNHYCFGNAFSPNPVIVANTTTICAGQTVFLSAAGCDNGTVVWYNGGSSSIFTTIGTGISISHTPSLTKNLYKATCTPFSNLNSTVSGFSNIIQVNLNANPNLDITSSAPITSHTSTFNSADKVVHISQSTDVTANCNGGNIVWENSSTNPIRNFNTSNAVSCSVNGYPSTYSVTCTNSNSCASALNIAISTSVGIDDNYTTPLNTFISGNVLSNDITNFNQVSPNLLQLSSTGTTITFQMPHGTIVFDKQNMSYALSGQFTYYPNSGFQGIDSFLYSTHDGLACNNNAATVTINVGIPCTTPPNPTSASASPPTINVGQSSILSASGCPVGTTYKWLYANTLGVASLNQSFTEYLYSTTDYTVHCVEGTCMSPGVPVTVTVGTNIPFSIHPTKYFAICQATATITSAGCYGIVNWYRDVDGSGANNQFLASGNTLTYTTDANWRQYIRATCTVGGEVSPLSNYCTVQTGPEIDPISYIVSPNTPITLNASGCPVGTTYLWATGETTQSITKSPAVYTLYFVKCVNNTCQSADGVSYISVGNVIANNDAYNLNIDTPVSANFTNNDGALSPKSIYVDYPPTHGSVIWDNNGEFTYTPTSNYTGTDSFTYYLTNSIGGYSNYATVTLNILCPSTLPLSSTNSPSDDFSSGIVSRQASAAGGSITATNKITGTTNVTYKAAKIELNAGFKAENGTVFKAEVGGCY